MSQSASQATAFYRDVAREGRLWVLLDDDGQLPISRGDGGQEVTPAWSSESRARKTQQALGPVHQEHQITAMAWKDFLEEWVPVLEKEGVLVGVNWSGDRARGHDVEVAELVRNVEGATPPSP